jgi:hypothetical protein
VPTWFERRRGARVTVAQPSAWSYGGPTSADREAGDWQEGVGVRVLTAAATRVTSREDRRRDRRRDDDGDLAWQEECWAMYDQVPEMAYVANALSGRAAQAVMYVERDGERVDNSEDEDPILALVTGQMVERMFLNVYVAGACFLCGLPVRRPSDRTSDRLQLAAPSLEGLSPHGEEPDEDEADGGTTGGNTRWQVYSSLEVRRKKKKTEVAGEEYDTDEVYVEKVWDPHPARWERADSPVRRALPVLRTLVGLTEHQSSQIDSRLAGAGVYWLPNDILNSAKVPGNQAEQQFSDNPVLNAIMAAMILPMEDRSNAAAFVPLLMGAPGDAISKIRFDSFSTPFDEHSAELLEGNVRRLGLGLDAPPELLSGMGDANHWGMWLVRDEVVSAHIDPRLGLLADALTTGFYRPIKRQMGDKDWESYEVKFDTSGLVQRPNRLEDASALHQVGAISDAALRGAGNFDEEDAPDAREVAVKTALQIASANPQLIDNMPEIVSYVLALFDKTPQTGPGGPLQSAREPGTLEPARGFSPTPAPPSTNGASPPAASAAGEGAPQAGSPV